MQEYQSSTALASVAKAFFVLFAFGRCLSVAPQTAVDRDYRQIFRAEAPAAQISRVARSSRSQKISLASAPSSAPSTTCITVAPGTSPAGGYLPLSGFGIAPIAGVGNDTITNFNVPSFTFGGVAYTQLGVDSNGYIVLGGGAAADNTAVNQYFPNPAAPNNVLAPYWTDLDPTLAGAVRIGTLTDGADTWIVIDWAGVPEAGNAANTHTFEIWIGLNTDTHPGEDVTYAYGAQTGTGQGGLLTVGAEGADGSRGATYYYNGTGTIPVNGTQLRVSTGVCTATCITAAPGASPAGGYLGLSLFGIAPIAGVGNDTITNFTVPAFMFGGAGYNRIGVDSNGYVVLGSTTAADNSPVNQIFPNPAAPNNVLAPYWTDLDPTAGGAMRIGTLTDGSNTWIVIDWAGVPERSNVANTHTFEIWIGITGDTNPAEDVTYVYGPQNGTGEGGLVTVGAENADGTHGADYYQNGAGTAPVNGTQLRIASAVCSATAAKVTVSGRVLTPDGNGLRNARVTMQDDNGNIQAVTTSAFGYYTFSDVTLDTYIIGVTAKRFVFDPRPVNVKDSLVGVDFTAR